MNPNWAEENLQTIRTLMERSAVYRRALAPIMIWCGVVGILGAVAGWQLKLDSTHSFVFYWTILAVIALVGAFLLARRQALKDAEPFWSPPTKRVVQALTPSFLIGAVIGGILGSLGDGGWMPAKIIIISWCWAFGCGLHAAGFFMPRGIRLLGWLFILAGSGTAAFVFKEAQLRQSFCSPHMFMGVIFGGLHLAYGIYLHFTEKKNSAT